MHRSQILSMPLCVEGARQECLGVQVPKLCALVRRGIGVNTRTGCARFITALTTRQGPDIKPHTPAFIKVTLNSMIHLVTVSREHVTALYG